jgi:hypothetical protein
MVLLAFFSAFVSKKKKQTSSILGYCLLPMVLLAFFSAFFSSTGSLMLVLTVIAVAWCTWRSSEMMVFL